MGDLFGPETAPVRADPLITPSEVFEQTGQSDLVAALADATLNGPTIHVQDDPSVFADLVQPGSQVPARQEPITIWRGDHPLPDGAPFKIIDPTLDEIEQIEDPKRRAWLLLARVMKKGSILSDRERIMIETLIGQDGKQFFFLEIFLFGSNYLDGLPLAPCLFAAHDIEIGSD